MYKFLIVFVVVAVLGISINQIEAVSEIAPHFLVLGGSAAEKSAGGPPPKAGGDNMRIDPKDGADTSHKSTTDPDSVTIDGPKGSTSDDKPSKSAGSSGPPKPKPEH